MRRSSGKSVFFACLAVSVGLHAGVLAYYAPALVARGAAPAPDEFRMIRAVVALKPKAVTQIVKPEIIRKTNDAVIVDEVREPEPVLTEANAADPAPAPDATPSEGTGEGVASTSETGAGAGEGNDFLPFYKVDVRPEYLFRAELSYPRQARSLGKEGSVVIEADIDAQGILVDVRVVKKGGFGFDEAAVEMIRASRFSPAFASGRPVAVRMRFTVNFKLKR